MTEWGVWCEVRKRDYRERVMKILTSFFLLGLTYYCSFTRAYPRIEGCVNFFVLLTFDILRLYNQIRPKTKKIVFPTPHVSFSPLRLPFILLKLFFFLKKKKLENIYRIFLAFLKNKWLKHLFFYIWKLR
jgi:hypothetical protein